MSTDDVWREVRRACGSLGPDEVLVTPRTERAFSVDEVETDRVRVHFVEADRDRALWQNQFEVLADRLADGERVAFRELPPGVEPYVAVLSLLSAYVATADALRARSADEEPTESPFVRSRRDVRTDADQVHDDAVLLSEVLGRLDLDDTSAVETPALVDAYVALSEVERGAADVRRRVRDELVERFAPDEELAGRFGTVRHTTRERRSVRDPDAVFDVLDEHGVPRDWVVGVDEEKLDVVVAVTDVDESAVYDVTEQDYVQKTGVDEDEKRAQLRSLRDQLAALEPDAGAAGDRDTSLSDVLSGEF